MAGVKELDKLGWPTGGCSRRSPWRSCGKATITLRHNSKIIIHGTCMKTHAEGTNRTKGGAEKIN